MFLIVILKTLTFHKVV